MDALTRTTEIVGVGAMARYHHVSRNAVVKWLKTRLPAERVLPTVYMMGGRFSPHDYRPDIYPDPTWLPPGLTAGGPARPCASAQEAA